MQSSGKIRLMQFLEGKIKYVHFHPEIEEKTYNYLLFK